MYCAKRASTNFLLDNILVDAMLSSTIILTGHILGARIQGFLLESGRGDESWSIEIIP
jgi:hypothetical protein